MLALLDHPDQLARLREDSSAMEDAVEEFMRFESPVQRVIRFPREQIAVGGQAIGKDEAIVLLVGAANRDPRQFYEPTVLDIARRPNRHLGFVMGVHHCTGAPLARLQAAIALREILDRYGSITLASTERQWIPNHAARRLERLPLEVANTFDPRSAVRRGLGPSVTIAPVEHDVGAASTFEDGTLRLVDITGTPVLIANVGGRISALQGTCTHEDYPLDDEDLNDHTVMCGLHFSRFDVRDGSVVDPPAEQPLHTYEVTVRDGRVMVRLELDAAPGRP
jgi:nitrite reductase/ring-hydroxylating ferredoxin subunit